MPNCLSMKHEMSVLLSYIYSLSATDELLLTLHHAKINSIFIKFGSTIVTGISLTKKLQNVFGGRRGRDRMVIGFTTSYAISAYHH